MTITRENVDALLDAGQIEVAVWPRGRWLTARRNGRTRRWKRDAARIRIPFKVGLRSCGQITERNFINGALDPTYFRAQEH